MRIQYKGGVWKNSEDEILKAAVMKYGQNQWARIASLLVRKSAKQCKARWYEWLDPAIKKTQWTREEEEKLLHLVKIMPTQWRTIAPIIGRTAAQCIEHYEILIDQAQQQKDSDSSGPSSADPKATVIAASRQRPGDFDAAPESRPARPDPVDMDEDELEMLSEARARLANTKGKKAKRKAREKQLEAAKRVAQLQKRRELKAAGVPIKPPRKSRKVIDYGTEIPFERTPAPGFYDVREEDERTADIMSDKQQIGKLLQKYMGPTEAEKEEEARRKDAAKRKQLEKTNLPAALGLEKALVAASAPRSPPLKKKRFSLPPPQLSDVELEKLSKSGKTPIASTRVSAQNTANEDRLDKSSARLSRTPFANSVASTPHATPAEPWAATRQRHLETIIALKSAETPLRGGENTPVPSLGLNGGVTPAGTDMRTPNPLATPSFSTATSHDVSNGMSSSRKQKAKQRKLQNFVRRGFATLPEPENEYELDFGDEQSTLNKDDETSVEGELVEDAEEELQRSKKEAQDQIDSIKKRLLSSAALRDLPIPSKVLHRDLNRMSIDYLVEHDQRVLNVLIRTDSSADSLKDTARALKSLAEEEAADVGDMKRANSLIDEYIARDNQSKSLKEEILEALEAAGNENNSSPQKLQLTAEEISTVDVSLRNDEQFQKEREERLKELRDVHEKHGCVQINEKSNAQELWQKMRMRISDEVEGIRDEEGVLEIVKELRKRISKTKVPVSLSGTYGNKSKGSLS